MTKRILRRKDVEYSTGLPTSTLYDRIAQNQFPKPISLGGGNSRSVGWLESDVQQWIEDQIAKANDCSTNNTEA